MSILVILVSEKMEGRNLSLDWQNFQSFAFNTLKDLRSDEHFINVTLVCDDGKQFDAHKVILSSSSSVFQSMLTANKRQSHPIIHLRGTSGKDFQRVLDFMYLGQVEVPEDDMDNFLAVATDFKVRGIVESTDYETGLKSKSKPQKHIFLKKQITKTVEETSNRDSLDIIKSLAKLP